MFFVILAALFLPQQVVTQYPAPQGCLSSWGADGNMIQNVCHEAVEVDVAFKNGLGKHFSLDPYESIDIGHLKIPYHAAACEKGKGVASAEARHLVRPGYASKGYVCLSQHLDFGPPTRLEGPWH
jgi:hypothetical protein